MTRPPIRALIPVALSTFIMMTFPALVWAGGCNFLQVAIFTEVADASIDHITCEHGNDNTQPPFVKGVSVPQFVQGTAYGPDCTIILGGAAGTAVLRAQQNYCALEAGDITASVASGPAELVLTQKGDYTGGPGWVVFIYGGPAKGVGERGPASSTRQRDLAALDETPSAAERR